MHLTDRIRAHNHESDVNFHNPAAVAVRNLRSAAFARSRRESASEVGSNMHLALHIPHSRRRRAPPPRAAATAAAVAAAAARYDVRVVDLAPCDQQQRQLQRQQQTETAPPAATVVHPSVPEMDNFERFGEVEDHAARRRGDHSHPCVRSGSPTPPPGGRDLSSSPSPSSSLSSPPPSDWRSLRNDTILRFRRNLQNRNSAAAELPIRFGPKILLKCDRRKTGPKYPCTRIDDGYKSSFSLNHKLNHYDRRIDYFLT
eukprot:SAG25_NODE_432_length_8108_cov_357.746442_8_plen_257_part_00